MTKANVHERVVRANGYTNGYFKQVVEVLPDDTHIIPNFLHQLIFEYMGQHRGQAPRFILAGRRELHLLELTDAPMLINLLIEENEQRIYVSGIQVLGIVRESFFELVG